MTSGTVFYKNLRSVAGNFAQSAVCGNTYLSLITLAIKKIERQKISNFNEWIKFGIGTPQRASLRLIH